MSQSIDTSINKIDKMIVGRLSSLKKNTTMKDIKQINSYLNEMRKMKDSLVALSNAGECAADVQEFEWELADLFMNGCDLVVALYSLIDYQKLDENEMDWVCDDAAMYIEAAQQIFGPRIPDLPIIYLEKALSEAIEGL